MTSPMIPGAELQSLRKALAARYSIERELGRGGMGTVYLARELKLDRMVALKVLPAEFATQVTLRDRFLRETRTAASFSHPNIVPVYAVEEGDDFLAYAMGFVEGETLTERTNRMGPLPVREIVRVLQDVGYALAYAHGRGVVHRDIKPDNIMLERATGRALVMDFGISRSIAHAAPSASLTRVGEVVGTPEYMSPEQAAGDTVDGRSDLYSLGLAAEFAATGRTVVTAESTQKVLVKQLTEQIPPIAGSRPDLPAALATAIDRCVEKDPADRFPSAEALVEAIDAAQLSAPVIPVPVRVFANEVSTLSLLAFGIVLGSWFVLKGSELQSLDAILPVVGLFAVLFTRTLTTLSEARRLAVAGFTVDDVLAGFAGVVDERAERRAELRADADTRKRRRATVIWSVFMLAGSIAMIAAAFRTRVKVAEHQYSVPIPGVILIFSGVALLGTALVLLFKSPLRMPVGERLFRIVWLGPLGRSFVRFGGRGVNTKTRSGERLRTLPPATIPPAHVSGVRATTPPAASAGIDRVAALEHRVSALESWRDRNSQH